MGNKALTKPLSHLVYISRDKVSADNVSLEPIWTCSGTVNLATMIHGWTGLVIATTVGSNIRVLSRMEFRVILKASFISGWMLSNE